MSVPPAATKEQNQLWLLIPFWPPRPGRGGRSPVLKKSARVAGAPMADEPTIASPGENRYRDEFQAPRKVPPAIQASPMVARSRRAPRWPNILPTSCPNAAEHFPPLPPPQGCSGSPRSAPIRPAILDFGGGAWGDGAHASRAAREECPSGPEVARRHRSRCARVAADARRRHSSPTTR